MAVRDDRSDVKQTTAGFRGPLMVQSLTSAKSKFLSLLSQSTLIFETDYYSVSSNKSCTVQFRDFAIFKAKTVEGIYTPFSTALMLFLETSTASAN